MPECKKCKTTVSSDTLYDHRCYECDMRLCRHCDDTTATLNWVECPPDNIDRYLCKHCAKKCCAPVKDVGWLGKTNNQ